MNTLEKILKQDLVCALEGQKLIDLKSQYVKEKRKYPNNYFVIFTRYGKEKLGRIWRANYSSGLICYTIFVVTKNGVKSNADKAHYYINEKDLLPYPILNALNNQ